MMRGFLQVHQEGSNGLPARYFRYLTTIYQSEAPVVASGAFINGIAGASIQGYSKAFFQQAPWLTE